MKAKPLDLGQIVTITMAVNEYNHDGSVVVLYSRSKMTRGQINTLYRLYNEASSSQQRCADPTSGKDESWREEVLSLVELVACLGWERDLDNYPELDRPIKTNISRKLGLYAYVVGMEG